MTNDRQFVANLPFLHIQNKNRVPNSFLLYICTLYFANLLKTNLTVLLVMTAVFIGINAFNDIVRKGVEIKSKDKE